VVERRDRHHGLDSIEFPARDRMAFGGQQHRLSRPARAGEQRTIGRDGAVPGKRLVLAARKRGQDVGRMARRDVEMRTDRREGHDRPLGNRADDREDVGLDAGEGGGTRHGRPA
jgi:hypothetical protein